MKPFEILTVSALLFAATGCASDRATTFATPLDAVHGLAAAAGDREAAEELLGPGGSALLHSGDDVADRADVETMRALVGERVEFEDVGDDCVIAVLGDAGWEFPLPLVRVEAGWRYDVEAGREEVLNRRVGRNELLTIATLRAAVEAQREYAAQGRDGKPAAYARRFVSSEGLHDGLYWPAAEGEAESPMGPLVAEAAREGYSPDEAGSVAFHGYFYRLLTAQGAHAPGGARSYLDEKGQLTGGFAVLAWPATWGNSGVMTFLVNRQGIVFQRDLGEQTETLAASIEVYDPDLDWTPTGD